MVSENNNMVKTVWIVLINAVVTTVSQTTTTLQPPIETSCSLTSEYYSPIDLAHPELNEELQPLNVHNQIHSLDFMQLHASNFHVTLKPSTAHTIDELPFISGGVIFLDKKYVLGEVSFASKSRHGFAGFSYPLEVNFYFYDRDLKSFGEAKNTLNSIVAVGVIFKEAEGDYGQDFFLGPNQDTLRFMTKSFMPKDILAYYYYNGSLVDSPCQEPVTWIVTKQIHKISPQHLSVVTSRMFASGSEMTFNNSSRTLIQPIGKRKVYSSVKKNTGDHSYYKTKIPDNIDHFFLFIMSIIIFFMQCGFAFMEAGAVKSKNTVNILIKNWLDVCFGALIYYATGFAFTYGPNGNSFISYSYFFGIGMPAYKLSKWFFNFVFAATAATLVSGALAERCQFLAYVIYSMMITGFIYPVIAHWGWHHQGFLRVNGFHDFAGSGVVHLCGAVCALVGCVLMGPRIGRFTKDGRINQMPGHSIPLSALGGFILIFGFLACNGAKRGSISYPNDGVIIVTAIVNTVLGTSAAGITTLITNKTGFVPGTDGTYSLLTTINGSLTGTIALCAGCDVYKMWASVVVGALSGPLYLLVKVWLLRFRVDDPLDAIPVHGGGGLWGLVAAHIFMKNGILVSWTSRAFMGLLWNCIGALAIIVWTGITCYIMFIILKRFKLLRVDSETEFRGMDLIKHGESAYPADAWVERQYNHPTIKTSSAVPSSSFDTTTVTYSQAANFSTSGNLPPQMSSSGSAAYNNVEEMFPSQAKLINALRNSMAMTQTAMEREKEPEREKKKETFQSVMKNIGSLRDMKFRATPDFRKGRRRSSVQSEVWIKNIVMPTVNSNNDNDNDNSGRMIENKSQSLFHSAIGAESSNQVQIPGIVISCQEDKIEQERRGSKVRVQKQPTFEDVTEDHEEEEKEEQIEIEVPLLMKQENDDHEPVGTKPMETKKNKRKVSAPTRTH